MASIRWREQDRQELQRTVKNFNAKIRYWEKQDMQGLPDTVKMSELKELMTTRQDFNREVNRLQRFGRKGAEETRTLDSGLTITKWERQELGRDKAIVNRKRKMLQNEIKQIEATSRGEPLGMKRGEMGSARLNSYNPRTFDIEKIRNKTELRKLQAALKAERASGWVDKKASQLQTNYIKALYELFGSAAQELVNHIANMDPKRVVEIYMTDEQASIEYVYSAYEASAKYEILLNVWQFPKEERDDAIDEFETFLDQQVDQFQGFEGYDGFS